MRYSIKDYIEPTFNVLKSDTDFQFAINNNAADILLTILYNNGYPRCYDLADALIHYANSNN